jgi:transcriptional regulator with XRE-family HTH domain
MAQKQSLRYLRRLADLTQEQLADKAGVHPVTLSKYERGVISPSVLVLQRIAQALGVDESEIELGARVTEGAA